jgi:hypothetical protein
MTRIRIPLWLVAAGLIGGCAASPEKPAESVAANTANAANGGKVCSREYKIGSNIPVTTCETAASEGERQRMIDAVKETFRPAPARNPAGGGGG